MNEIQFQYSMLLFRSEYFLLIVMPILYKFTCFKYNQHFYISWSFAIQLDIGLAYVSAGYNQKHNMRLLLSLLPSMCCPWKKNGIHPKGDIWQNYQALT